MDLELCESWGTYFHSCLWLKPHQIAVGVRNNSLAGYLCIEKTFISAASGTDKQPVERHTDSSPFSILYHLFCSPLAPKAVLLYPLSAQELFV